MTCTRRIADAMMLLCAITFGASGCAAHAASDPPASAPSVPLVVARHGFVLETVEVQGRVGPPAGSSAKLVFAEPGIVHALDVRVGETVAAGDAVAELDRAALRAPLEQARGDALAAAAGFGGGVVPDAAVRSAESKLAVTIEKLATLERGGPSALSGRIAAESAARQAVLKVDGDLATTARERDLFAAGVVARKELDAALQQLASDRADSRAADARVSLAASDFASALTQAKADVASARSDLAAARSQSGVLQGASDSARAKLDAARIAYANGVLRAPAAGVVLSILKHPGEAVDETTPVVEIGPQVGHTATLTVPDDLARRVVVGDPVTIDMPGSPSRRGDGRIIAVVPVVDATTQVATLVASGVPADAVPGDAISATIAVGRARGVIVPTSAIVEDPQTGKTVVFVHVPHPEDEGSAFSMRAVDVRANDAMNAALGAGLRAGESVAARGGYTLLAPAGD